MSRTRLLLAAVLTITLGATGVASAADPDPVHAEPRLLLDTIRANRRALVSVNLNLTEQEATAFWPLYDRYQSELMVIGDRIADLVEDYIEHYRDLSDEKALQLMDAYLAGEGERIALRRAYLPQFAKILPGRTVARFYQVENKMDAVLRYELASTIPVVDEAPPAPAK
jgi:hypothetical protein